MLLLIADPDHSPKPQVSDVAEDGDCSLTDRQEVPSNRMTIFDKALFRTAWFNATDPSSHVVPDPCPPAINLSYFYTLSLDISANHHNLDSRLLHLCECEAAFSSLA